MPQSGILDRSEYFVHYDGWPASWDEWMEMNTQRILVSQEAICRWESMSSTLPVLDDDGQSSNKASKEKVSKRGGNSTLMQKLSDTNEQVKTKLAASGDKEQFETAFGKQSPQNENSLVSQKTQTSRPNTTANNSNSHPLSMRLAYRSVMGDTDAQFEAYPEDRGTIKLPHREMTTRDYMVFFKIGDKIRTRGIDKEWYEGTILEIKNGRLKIRCEGWPPEFDEWIAFNSKRLRVLRQTIETDDRLEKLVMEEKRRARKLREQRRAETRKERARELEKTVDALANSLEFIGTADNTAVAAKNNIKDGDADPGANLTTLAEQEKLFGESEHWFVYCDQCRVVIKQFRYFCTHCEKPSEGYDYNSFELCLW